MSGASRPAPPGGPAAGPAAPGGAADPSMEDILASIRRILSEDEQPNASQPSSVPGPAPASTDSGPDGPGGDAGDVLVLDAGMMVPDPLPAAPAASGLAPAAPPPAAEPPPPARPAPEAQATQSAAPPTTAPELTLDQGPLVDAQTRLAAASSVGNLVRTLSAGRAAQVHRGGPTIEDLVREMMRPLLKEWLDRHLPGLVERLVAAEIEKVVRNSGL